MYSLSIQSGRGPGHFPCFQKKFKQVPAEVRQHVGDHLLVVGEGAPGVALPADLLLGGGGSLDFELYQIYFMILSSLGFGSVGIYSRDFDSF